MKRKTLGMLSLAIATVAMLAPALIGKQSEGELVDSGVFSVMVNGKHVASETFKIMQNADGSLTHSELRVIDPAKPAQGEGKPEQSYDMELDSSGNLRSYRWERLQNQKATLTVEPSDSLLVEHMVDPNGKQHSLQHMLPTSTVILDDNFFSQRELLAWRFMASGCKPDTKGLRCELPKREYGVLDPTEHLSSDVFVEFVGQEKAAIKGSPQTYVQIRITGEEGEWLMWLDDHEKVIKIEIPGANTEVLRD